MVFSLTKGVVHLWMLLKILIKSFDNRLVHSLLGIGGSNEISVTVIGNFMDDNIFKLRYQLVDVCGVG